MLAVFEMLRIAPGFTLRAYQYSEGGDGNGFVSAMPAKAPFPEPDECERVNDVFLQPPMPPGALDDVMMAIQGDGSLRSYLCASILAREFAEFGAGWHGQSWSWHILLGANPVARRSERVADRTGLPSSPPEEWEWWEPEPVEWRPCVRAEGDQITVTFFTYTNYVQESIILHTDVFSRGSYQVSSEESTVAHGRGGAIP